MHLEISLLPLVVRVDRKGQVNFYGSLPSRDYMALARSVRSDVTCAHVRHLASMTCQRIREAHIVHRIPPRHGLYYAHKFYTLFPLFMLRRGGETAQSGWLAGNA